MPWPHAFKAPEREVHRGVFLLAIALIGFSIMFALQLWGSEKPAQFEEEVMLPGGESIVIDRHMRVTSLGELGGPGGWKVTYDSVLITRPAVSESPVAWESNAGLIAVLLDRDASTGEWILVSTFDTCDAWYELGRPKLPYAKFRLRQGSWNREALGRDLVGREANVYTDVPVHIKGRRLTWNEKRGLNADPRIAPKFVRIVDHWTTGC